MFFFFCFVLFWWNKKKKNQRKIVEPVVSKLRDQCSIMFFVPAFPTDLEMEERFSPVHET